MSTPPFETPIVLEAPDIAPIPIDDGVLFAPATDGPAPAIVFVHGMPFPPDWPPPSRWKVYTGYGAHAAARGCVGAVVDHSDGSPDYDVSAERVTEAIAAVRAHPRVDGDRVGLWFFSGGGPLSAPYLRAVPDWLRCLALTYPLLDEVRSFPVPVSCRPIEAIAAAPGVPIVVTTCGREDPALTGAVDRFRWAADSAGVELTIVDVPDGQHAFDMRDYTQQSREAVARALDLVTGHVHGSLRRL